MDIIFLAVLSIVPGLFLLGVVLYMDRQEREPMRMIIFAFFLGVLSTVPAIMIEFMLGVIPVFRIPGITGAFLSSFIQVAPVEEAVKLGVIMLFIYRHKEFNEENDGIVYVAVSALGFAVFENIFYVLQYGMTVGIMRAFTAVPIHCFTGVIMGYFVGTAKFLPDKAKTKSRILKGYLLAYIIHASYNTLALSCNILALLIFPVVIATIVIGLMLLRRGRRLSIARWSKEGIPGEIGVKISGRWKIVISRVLFVMLLGFWLLIAVGYSLETDRSGIDIYSLIAGGLVISFIPFAIGFVLEMSFRRDKKRAAGKAEAEAELLFDT